MATKRNRPRGRKGPGRPFKEGTHALSTIKLPNGAQTLCTPEVQRILVESMRHGSTKKLACDRAGIHIDTLMEWQRRGKAGEEPFRTLVLEMSKALGDLAVHDMAIVTKAAREGEYRAAIWRLENRFGIKAANQHKIEGTVEQKPAMPRLDLSQLTMDEIAQLERLLRKAAPKDTGVIDVTPERAKLEQDGD